MSRDNEADWSTAGPLCALCATVGAVILGVIVAVGVFTRPDYVSVTASGVTTKLPVLTHPGRIDVTVERGDAAYTYSYRYERGD